MWFAVLELYLVVLGWFVCSVQSVMCWLGLFGSVLAEVGSVSVFVCEYDTRHRTHGP